MAAKVTASEMMKSHITSFLEGMANGDASRIPGACAPNGKFASLTEPPAEFTNRLLKNLFEVSKIPQRLKPHGVVRVTARLKLSPFKATVLSCCCRASVLESHPNLAKSARLGWGTHLTYTLTDGAHSKPTSSVLSSFLKLDPNYEQHVEPKDSHEVPVIRSGIHGTAPQ